MHNPNVTTQREGDELTISFAGDWDSNAHQVPIPADILTPPPSRITANADELTSWGSPILVFLQQLKELCDTAQVPLDSSSMPEGVSLLLNLAAAVPEHKSQHKQPAPRGIRARTGNRTLEIFAEFLTGLSFLGECAIAFGRLFIGKAKLRASDLGEMIFAAGPAGLPIVTLISFLVGMIVAFMGSVQLKAFGAEIYVADMVSLGMMREMGALMTGIIIAGRTGAAYAAQLGTMQVNEEIDALRTTGISPIEFLVLPRMIALILMTPLLTIYANVIGIIGGAVIGITMLDIGLVQYWNETVASLWVSTALSGVVKSIAFGMLVAFAGCWRGMQCGRNASAVGDATTRAVVSGIVYIIVADAILSIIFMIIGF